MQRGLPPARFRIRTYYESLTHTKNHGYPSIHSLIFQHWWDYSVPGMVDVGLALTDLKKQGLIKCVPFAPISPQIRTIGFSRELGRVSARCRCCPAGVGAALHCSAHRRPSSTSLERRSVPPPAPHTASFPALKSQSNLNQIQ